MSANILEAQKVRGQKRGHYSPPGLEKSPSGPTSCTPVGPFFWTHLAPEGVEIQLQPQRSFRVSKLHVCIMQTERRERRKETAQKSMRQTQHHESATLRVCVYACWVSSVVFDSATPWTVAHQAPLSMGFSRQEYWSGLPCPPPGDLPDPGIKPASLESPALAGRFFNTRATWEVQYSHIK